MSNFFLNFGFLGCLLDGDGTHLHNLSNNKIFDEGDIKTEKLSMPFDGKQCLFSLCKDTPGSLRLEVERIDQIFHEN